MAQEAASATTTVCPGLPLEFPYPHPVPEIKESTTQLRPSSLSSTKRAALTDWVGMGENKDSRENFPSLGEFTLKFVPDNVISKLVLWSVARM